jgi:hypothetical protein
MSADEQQVKPEPTDQRLDVEIADTYGDRLRTTCFVHASIDNVRRAATKMKRKKVRIPLSSCKSDLVIAKTNLEVQKTTCDVWRCSLATLSGEL